MITHTRLLEVLDYDPTSGELRWKISGKGIQRGALAGRSEKNKTARYSNVKIDQKPYFVHRLIWFYMTKEWPKETIDHKNRNPFDNRWENLREATRSQNGANRRGCGGKYSSLKGVSFLKRTGLFTASIKVNGRLLHLGCFPSDTDAHQAYVSASKHHFGEFACA